MSTSIRIRPLMTVLAVAALVLGQTAVGAIATARAGDIIPIDPCLIAPDDCSTLTFAPFGDGIGSMSTLSGLGGQIDLLIDCRRQGGTTYGTCGHRYYVGAGHTKTIDYELQPAVGSKVCPTPLFCSTSTLSRQIVLNPGTSVSAKTDFELAHPEKLTVSIAGAGSGHLLSQPIGIDCATSCSADFNFGTDIVLYLAVGPGSDFRGWSVGPCAGQGTECHFKIGTDTTIAAAIRQPLATPIPTPIATPIATPVPTPIPTKSPVATPKPTKGPRPSAVATNAPTGTATVAPTSAADGGIGNDAPSAAPNTEPAATAAADGIGGNDDGTGTPDAPASAGSGPDVALLAGAIVLAGLIVAVALFAGLRRRSDATAGAA